MKYLQVRYDQADTEKQSQSNQKTKITSYSKLENGLFKNKSSSTQSKKWLGQDTWRTRQLARQFKIDQDKKFEDQDLK